MSAETLEWLNNMTLIGNADVRGTAWHYQASMQGDRPNHYPGFIPGDDIRERIFNWRAVEAPVTATLLLPEGVATITDDARKAICRPPGAFGDDDRGAILGTFKSGYQSHDYQESLVDNVQAIMSGGCGYASAGMLKGGAQAFVTIQMPESIRTASGVEFLPNLLACTSHDGTLATTYHRTAVNVVCDNTMSAALRDGNGQTYKVKHSRYSSLKLAEARDALGILHEIADDFSAQVERLTNVQVSEGDWSAFLDAIAPVPAGEGRAATMAENRRGELSTLWHSDARVLPWKGTAWGVVQCVNTYAHHVATAHGGKNAERNILRAMNGKTDALDAGTLAMLEGVLQNA